MLTSPSPTFLTERRLDERFGTAALLDSRGDYGCGCAVYDGALDDRNGVLFDDDWFYGHPPCPGDLGTVLVTGEVRSTRPIFVSDRLMCLVVLGDVVAPSLHLFATEMYVGGKLVVGALHDPDRLLKQAKGV